MSKQYIKRLKNEIDFLNKGIDSREEAYASIYNEKETQVKLVKEITYMLLHMEVIEDLIKNDHNHTSKIVKKAFAQLNAYVGRNSVSSIGQNQSLTSLLN